MSWRRNDKTPAESARDDTPALPHRSSAKGQDRYCTTCEDWYPPSKSGEHEH